MSMEMIQQKVIMWYTWFSCRYDKDSQISNQLIVQKGVIKEDGKSKIAISCWMDGRSTKWEKKGEIFRKVPNL